jgi:hypothetical protein
LRIEIVGAILATGISLSFGCKTIYKIEMMKIFGNFSGSLAIDMILSLITNLTQIDALNTI